jgi:hypothetical protein
MGPAVVRAAANDGSVEPTSPNGPERYLNVELPRGHRDRSRWISLAPESDGSAGSGESESPCTITATRSRARITTQHAHIHARRRRRRRRRRSVYGIARTRLKLARECEHRRTPAGLYTVVTLGLTACLFSLFSHFSHCPRCYLCVIVSARARHCATAIPVPAAAYSAMGPT